MIDASDEEREKYSFLPPEGEDNLDIIMKNRLNKECLKETRLGKVPEKIGRWSDEEHGLFLKGLSVLFGGQWNTCENQLFNQGLRLYHKNWKKLAQIVKTRTVVQVRTHAQKYFQKLEKAAIRSNNNNDNSNMLLTNLTPYDSFSTSQYLQQDTSNLVNTSHVKQSKSAVEPASTEISSYATSNSNQQHYIPGIFSGGIHHDLLLGSGLGSGPGTSIGIGPETATVRDTIPYQNHNYYQTDLPASSKSMKSKSKAKDLQGGSHSTILSTDIEQYSNPASSSAYGFVYGSESYITSKASAIHNTIASLPAPPTCTTTSTTTNVYPNNGSDESNPLLGRMHARANSHPYTKPKSHPQQSFPLSLSPSSNHLSYGDVTALNSYSQSANYSHDAATHQPIRGSHLTNDDIRYLSSNNVMTTFVPHSSAVSSFDDSALPAHTNSWHTLYELPPSHHTQMHTQPQVSIQPKPRPQTQNPGPRSLKGRPRGSSASNSTAGDTHTSNPLPTPAWPTSSPAPAQVPDPLQPQPTTKTKMTIYPVSSVQYFSCSSGNGTKHNNGNTRQSAAHSIHNVTTVKASHSLLRAAVDDRCVLDPL